MDFDAHNDRDIYAFETVITFVKCQERPAWTSEGGKLGMPNTEGLAFA